jgi:hypothetical protein
MKNEQPHNASRRGSLLLLPLGVLTLLVALVTAVPAFFASCAHPTEDMLADSLLVDSLMGNAAAPDSDITYAPVSSATLNDASTLIDASRLMTEDSTQLAADTLDAAADTLAPLTWTQRFRRWLTTPRDSLLRLTPERFSVGCNFEVTVDTLRLRQWPLTDEVMLRRGDEVVVAERMTLPADSADAVWVKLAHDQSTMGWVAEDELSGRLLPDDSVSRFIHFFSRKHHLAFLAVLCLFGLGFVARSVRRKAIRLDEFRHIDSFCSVLLMWLLASTASLYAFIQQFFADAWQQFYYHPSLNPLDLSPLLGLFILMVWGIVWVSIAVADEIYHQPRLETAFYFSLVVMSYGILIYLLFTLLPFVLGLPAWIAYTALSATRFRYLLRYRYTCGRCGAHMHAKGKCPECGALNE